MYNQTSLIIHPLRKLDTVTPGLFSALNTLSLKIRKTRMLKRNLVIALLICICNSLSAQDTLKVTSFMTTQSISATGMVEANTLSGTLSATALSSITGLTLNNGITVTGGVVSLNNNSSFAANINTGTSTGTITLGGTGAAQVIDIGPAGSGAKTITINSNTNLAHTTDILGGNGADAITLVPQTTGGIIIGNSTGTGQVSLGVSTAGQTVNIGNANNTVAQAINIGAGTGSANNTINIGSGLNTGGVTAITIGTNTNFANTTLIEGGNGAGAITLLPQTTGTIVIGGVTNTGSISLGVSTGGQTVNIGNANNTVAQTINIGAGVSTANNTINIGSGLNTGGVTSIILGTNTNLANTTLIEGGNGAGAIALAPHVTGAIVIGNISGTGQITLGSSTATQTVVIGNGSAAAIVRIATGVSSASMSVTIGDPQNSAPTSPLGSIRLAGSTVIANGAFNFATGGGTAQVQTATCAGITGPINGQMIVFRASVANTGAAPTLSLNGTTARNVVKRFNTALAAGDIALTGTYLLVYDAGNTRWQLLNPTVP